MTITDAQLRDAIDDFTSGEPVVGAVYHLAQATRERGVAHAPAPVCDALDAMIEAQRQVDNGGYDQLVWNLGVDASRRMAELFRGVGAVESADLIERLAAALAGRAVGEGEAVARFLAFRQAVGGPFFDAPDPTDEVELALLEYALDHQSEFRGP